MEDYQYKSLTETIDNMKEYIELLKSLKDDYKNKIDRAIKYIESELDETGGNVSGSDLPYRYIEDILDILKGEL